MAKQLLKGIVDLIYGTNKIRKKYQIENSPEIVLASDASKGIITKGNDDIEHGVNWVTAQRAVLLLTTKNIVCGKWKIPLENIQNAQLLRISSLLGSGQVLKIQTKDNSNYQFGMQLNKEWTSQQILPLELENGQVKKSITRIIIRIIIFGYLAYLLYQTIYQ